MDEARTESLHGVAIMRDIRDRLNEELADMSARELSRWLRAPQALPDPEASANAKDSRSRNNKG